MTIHLLFDFLAAISALAMTAFVYRWRLSAAGQKIERAGPIYALALVAGAATGGFGAGTLNLWLSGEAGFVRSIVEHWRAPSSRSNCSRRCAASGARPASSSFRPSRRA